MAEQTQKSQLYLCTDRADGGYIYMSPLGAMEMTCDGKGLTALNFVAKDSAPQIGYRAASLSEIADPVIRQTVNWLDIYFSGGVPDFIPPLNLDGSPFRKKVWNLLLSIPYGRTVTYGQIAERIAREEGRRGMSAQAVGGAVGHNPVAIIVPCHRVLGVGGTMTGYAAGVVKKLALLKIEGVIR